jgi:hypothetical protein
MREELEGALKRARALLPAPADPTLATRALAEEFVEGMADTGWRDGDAAKDEKLADEYFAAKDKRSRKAAPKAASEDGK